MPRLPEENLDQRLSLGVGALSLPAGRGALAPLPVLASATSWVQHEIVKLHSPWVYVVVGALVLVEVGILIGFFIPGEIATIVGGVVASQHQANLVLMIVVVVVAATLGNISGYEIGRIVGPWLTTHRPLKGNPGIDRTERFLARRGAPAVIIGRWVAVVRAFLPGIIGMSGMDRRKFALLSAVGGVGWGTMWVLIGFALGKSYTKAVNASGMWSLVVLGVVVAAILGFAVWRSIREHRARAGRGDGGGGGAGQTAVG
ncbi:MAG TPA: DedA family protein [Acidimicrobiales bacterium]|nr:DedA family protein [Acidimicrobiales bacterium]